MANPDRLSGLDASFLALERGVAHMHVGSVLVFDGEAPPYEELVAHLEQRLHLVPRYRQRLAWVPFEQGRPVWVDDPHFNVRYHVRHTALPGRAGEAELAQLAGRVFSQRLDRSKPLWELWLVDAVRLPADGEPHFALVTKTHHCLVDGVSGVDLATVMFDLEPDPPERPVAEGERAWFPRPEPSRTVLLADALAERVTAPGELLRSATRLLGDARGSAARAAHVAGGAASVVVAGFAGAPPSPFNVAIGPHRRFTWVETSLARFKAIKDALGGTVNDVILTVVTGALRSYYLDYGIATADVTLKAMVPMSVRADTERGALGNRVTTMYAPLPVGERDPARRFAIIRAAMEGLKESGQAVGAEALTRLAGFAPPTVLAQASRLQARQRLFNLTITNVPGPQFPLYMGGHRLRAIHPQVPLAENTALGVAIMSYDGGLFFGLIGDYDALPDLGGVAAGLREAIDELEAVAGGRTRPRRARRQTPAT